MKIKGIEGMTWNELHRELQLGGRFIIFQYCTSIIVLTSKRASDIYFIKAGESAVGKGLLFSLWSFLFGWWGIPWGPIYTIESLAVNFGGGRDVTQEVLVSLGMRFLDAQRSNARLSGLGLEMGTAKSKSERARQGRIGIFWGILLGVILTVGCIALLVVGVFTTHKPDSLIPTPTATVKAEIPPPGWTLYSSAGLGFSACIPEDWIPEAHPKQPDNPGQAVSFAAAPDDMGPDATVITVIAFPMLDASGSEPLAIAELKQSAEGWLKDRGARTVRPVAETEIGFHPAVWMVHEVDAADGSFTARGYAAFVSTPEWLYYLEVAGFAEYDETLRGVYETFAGSFRSPVQ